MRDSGPISVKNNSGEVAFTHWHFTGWAKYRNHKKDAVAAAPGNKKPNRPMWDPAHKSHPVVFQSARLDANAPAAPLSTRERLPPKRQNCSHRFTAEAYD